MRNHKLYNWEAYNYYKYHKTQKNNMFLLTND